MQPRPTVTTEELCLCGKPLGDGTLILIESGQMLPSRKDARFLRFYPDWTLPSGRWSDPYEPESVLYRAIHIECFIEHFNQADVVWRTDPKTNECQVCSLNFETNRWAHRYTPGQIERGTFEPDLEMMPRKGIVCCRCAQVIAQEPQQQQTNSDVRLRKGQLTLL
jgi:hypothetical protein